MWQDNVIFFFFPVLTALHYTTLPLYWLIHVLLLLFVWLQAGEASQVETVSEENKSLVWTLLKQLRPGMDLSKVVLPTFILEPRSFLDKLSDYYYHADLLSQLVSECNFAPKQKTQFCLYSVYSVSS